MKNFNTNDIIKMITQALEAQNNQIRSSSQNFLVQMRNYSPTNFFIGCAQIMSDQQNDDKLRQSTGTVAGRLLSQKNQNTNIYFWDQISMDKKIQIKQIALSILISPSIVVMKASASMLSYILAVQLPRNQFQDVIDVLADNCNNSNHNFKNASITTLGFICQQIKNFNQKINFRMRQQILGGLLYGFNDNDPEITKTSLRALENCLSFLGDMMDNKNYRDTIFNFLINQFSKQILIEQTYYVFYEFVKISSKYLGTYKQSLLKFSQIHLDQRGDIALRNIQLWQTIGNDYLTKIKNDQERIGSQNKQQNFLISVADVMLPNLMKCLLIQNKEEENQQDIRQSAAKAISAFAQSCDKPVIDLIVESVSILLGLQNPYQKQAAAVLFSCIVDYPDTNYIKNLFQIGFEHLFQLIMSNSQLVVKKTLFGFIRLSQAFPNVFLNHKNIAAIIDQLFEYLNVGPQHSQVLSYASQILLNISEGLNQAPDVCKDPQILLRKAVTFYTQKRQQFHNNKQRQINQRFTIIIVNVVMKSSDNKTVKDLIDHMINQYYNVLKPNTEDKFLLIEQITTILHTCILVHKDAVPSAQLLQRICKLLDSHFKQYNVERQGLGLIGAVVTSFGRMFEDKYKRYWPYIQQSLGMVNQSATFKAGLSCVGDLARSLPSVFNPQALQVTCLLLEYVNNGSVDRDLKICIIAGISDMVLNLQKNTQQFLDQVIGLCNICFLAVYQLSNSQSQFQYVESLKSVLIQLYGCLIFSVQNFKQPSNKLLNHFGQLATFVVRSCAEDRHPTVDYVKMCLYLIFDSACFFYVNPQNINGVRNIVQSVEISKIVERAAKFKHRPDIRQMLDFIASRKRN